MSSDSEDLEILNEDTIEDKSKSKRTVKSGSNSGYFSKLFNSSPSLTESLSHSIYESFNVFNRLASNPLTPGHLTRDEFLLSGDHLVATDGGWEWASYGERTLHEFPPDRQYLVNRGVPCLKGIPNAKVYLDIHENELWTIPTIDGAEGASNFYDVSLTFDFNNRTPRIWLMGYNSEGQPLGANDIIGDMCIDFVGTVATLIPHPVTNVLNVSIHPCRHSDVMNRLIENRQTSLGETVDRFNRKHYLPLFINLINIIFPNLLLGEGDKLSP